MTLTERWFGARVPPEQADNAECGLLSWYGFRRREIAEVLEYNRNLRKGRKAKPVPPPHPDGGFLLFYRDATIYEGGHGSHFFISAEAYNKFSKTKRRKIDRFYNRMITSFPLPNDCYFNGGNQTIWQISD